MAWRQCMYQFKKMDGMEENICSGELHDDSYVWPYAPHLAVLRKPTCQCRPGHLLVECSGAEKQFWGKDGSRFRVTTGRENIYDLVMPALSHLWWPYKVCKLLAQLVWPCKWVTRRTSWLLTRLVPLSLDSIIIAIVLVIIVVIIIALSLATLCLLTRTTTGPFICTKK